MGHFRVDAEIVNARKPKKVVQASDLLVDSGSEFTWVSSDLLKKIGVRVEKKDVPFCMANGQTVTRATGYAIIRAAGFETIDEVVFAQKGDLALLGARTLEGFGALVDSRHKRLVAAGPYPAASLNRPKGNLD